MVIFPAGVSTILCSVGGDIRITSSNAVVQPLGRVEIDVELRVVRIAQIGSVKVLFHSRLLIAGHRVVVRETARAAKVDSRAPEVDLHHALWVVDRLVGVELGTTHRCNVRAVAGVLRVEDLALGTETSICSAIAWEGCDTVVTRGEEE